MRAAIGIGGNLGSADQLVDRFRTAERMLESQPGIVVTDRSPLYWSEPVGPVRDQPRFLNGVVTGELLCDGPYCPVDIASGSHQLNLPNNCAVIGIPFCVQGATFDIRGVKLVNALELTLGTF